MNCYNLETLNYKDGLFDDFIEATYVLTMENSDRRKDYMYQLEQFKPSSVVHIFHNKFNAIVINFRFVRYVTIFSI